MAPPPPELPAELVEQIFLRLPPGEPRRLFRASLVSKLWHRRLALPAFRRRYCELHQTPPVLGFLTTQSGPKNRFYNTHFEPIVKLCPSSGPGRRLLRTLDARHGRVLFQSDLVDSDPVDYWRLPEYIVWDPITHQEFRIKLRCPT